VPNIKLDGKVQGAEGGKHDRFELVKVDVLPTWAVDG
jgi:hypothetical protein